MKLTRFLSVAKAGGLTAFPVESETALPLESEKIFTVESETALPVEPETAELLRKSGDEARDRGNWPVASYYYGRLISFEPDDAALWLERGHMLKESGLLESAWNSYQQALTLRPNDPEVYLQLAILSKLRGDFDGAFNLFKEADGLGHPLKDFIDGEVASIRKISGESLTVPRSGGSGVRIFLSSIAHAPSETDAGGLKQFMGRAHYSYAYVMKGFRDGLKKAGIPCELIQNPEFVADIRRGSPAQVHIHLGFYPPDAARYLKGAYNIMIVAWEFERLKTLEEALSYHAFADPVAMLSRSQEVWLLSDYGAEAVRRSGLGFVRHVPAPVATSRHEGRNAALSLAEIGTAALRLDRISWVPLAIWPPIQPALSRQAIERSVGLLNLLLAKGDDEVPIFFLSIFNVHDYRKQIKPLLYAFSQFSQGNKNAYLILKVNCINGDNQTINEILSAEQVYDPGELTPPIVCGNVLITTEVLSRDEMNVLYELASFYVCTSYAEGQNLPLLEAMGHGVVPVSVDHTSMREYVTPDNAVVIPSTLAPLTTRLVHRYGMFGIETYHVKAQDVFASLVAAARLSDDEYFLKSQHAVKAVAERFGVEPLKQAIEGAIARSAADSVSGIA